MDTVDNKTRSRIMAAVSQTSTKPEMILRKELHHLGFRYLINDKRLPGTPDLVFPKYHACIFVHGCFWHRHGCKYSTTPKTRKEFWEDKFETNMKRDRKSILELMERGWRVKIIWECQLKKKRNQIITLVSALSDWLRNQEAAKNKTKINQ